MAATTYWLKRAVPSCEASSTSCLRRSASSDGTRPPCRSVIAVVLALCLAVDDAHRLRPDRISRVER